MDEYTAEAFANRDEAIPEVDFASEGGDDAHEKDADSLAAGGSTRKRDRVKSHVKGALRDVKNGHQEKLDSKADSGASLSLQDRLLARLLQQVVPVEDMEDGEESSMDSGSPYIRRPAFSLPLMTNNFRRFNARIGIVFVFQNRVIRLLSWRTPSHTLSLLFIYSFICLDPNLLAILPFAILLLFIMVPAFLARHPPPPPSTSTSSVTPYYSYSGPALAPAKTIRPASETSKDFFRNMRDLQNCMADFSNLHDAAVTLISPPTNFSNEALSSTLFLVFTVMTASLLISSNLIPWRVVFFIGGNATIILGHPRIQAALEDFQKKRAAVKDGGAPVDDWTVLGFSIPSSPSALMSFLDSVSDISLDSSPEEREVEIFELQHRRLSSSYSTPGEWEHFVFTPAPFDPLSPARIAGDRPRGTRFFEDVQPPKGWVWKSKKWELDLDCREWVMERMVTGVEFEIHSENGGVAIGEEFGGWVWDTALSSSSTLYGSDLDASSVAYGDFPESSSSVTRPESEVSKWGYDKGKTRRDWEEATAGANGIGEWRRRRWIRVVARTRMRDNEDKGD